METLERLKKDAELERVRAQAEARKRVLLEFERGQTGLSIGSSKPSPTSGSAKDENKDAKGVTNGDGKPEECACNYLSTSIGLVS